MTTRETLLAKAAEKHWRIFSLILENYSHEQARKEADRAFRAGANWEAQRSAVLLEALEKIMERTVAGVIRVERGQPNGLDATALDNIARAALEKYRGKQ